MPESQSRRERARVLRTRRRAVLRQAKQGAGGRPMALFVTKPADIRYLSGSTEGASALLFGRSWSELFSSNMYRHRVVREAPGSEVSVGVKGLSEAVAERLRDRRLGVLGIQQNVLTVSQHEPLVKACGGIDLHHIGDAVLNSRSIKDDDEIRVTRKAVKIAEKAFRQLTRQGTAYFVGRTERELAAELDYRMRVLGADRQAFPGGTIVASGPNSYYCHHMPGARKVKPAEPVLFDWGAEVQGYRSDISRVVFTGGMSDIMREIYGVVLRAHDAAVAAMRPGVRCHTVDAVARKIVKDAGYAKEFRHGLGHGIGLEVHERPGFGGKPKDGKGVPLKKNMIMTVEPGVYLEGTGGVRIEDDILLTAHGHERLNSLPRTLERMILR